MNKTLPDKYIRKAISDEINNIVVNTVTIPCYDTMVTVDVNSDDPRHYILMTTQSNEVDKNNKCEWFWESTILLDIVTRYAIPGRTGSRVLADDILEAVRDLLQGITLGGGLEVVTQDYSFPNDIVTETQNEVIYRKFLRLRLLIK